VCFETYEPFISLISKLFGGPWLNMDSESANSRGTPEIHLKLQVTEEKNVYLSSSNLGDYCL
jgi:hypothetical protein